MEAVFREEVRRVRAAGSTVLLSSHLLSEVEQLCDRVTIIRAGRAVETSTLAELVRDAATRFEVTGVDAARLGAVPGVTALEAAGGVVRFDAVPDALPGVLAALHEARPASLSAAPPTLESLFLRHYETDRA